MIFNRTLNDVNSAKTIREEKIKKSVELTESEIDIMERGTITINTLNRIENKQSELKDLFNSIGYWNTEIINKQWDATKIFDKSDFERVLKNLELLKNAFFVYSSTPKTPKPSYQYEIINDIEKILYDLEMLIEEVKSLWKECGDFQCGEA